MSSNDAEQRLEPVHRRQLLDVAGEAIRVGVKGARLPVRAEDFPEPLRARRASFVTLHVEGRLRGCVGTLDAYCSLVEGVANSAFAAAFEDHRFVPLTVAEYPSIEIHLSVLTIPEPISFSSESELLAQLRPHKDGLVLQDGMRRGTFLPTVWEQLPDPRAFLRALKEKAGLPADYWSPTLMVKRYLTESIP